MSLLMDALKKAEESKRQIGDNAAPPPELTLAPMTPAEEASTTAAQARVRSSPSASSNSPLPDLSLHSDALDAELAAVSAEPPRRVGTSRSAISLGEAQAAAEREAARNVFSVKQANAKPRSALPLILAIGGTAILLVGAYFWWQLQALSGSSLAPVGGINVPATVRPLPALVVSATEPEMVITSVNDPSAPPPSKAQTASPNAILAATPPAPEKSVFAERQAAPRARPQKTPAAPATTDAMSEPEPMVRISRRQPKPQSSIASAYDALLAGQFELAQRAYETVLRRDPKSTDALLGLATIAGSAGQTDRAYQYYLLALESNPTNATAQAGLVMTGSNADPALAESRLKSALASQPDSAALHFALGNIYARQKRWSEAQQAYFNAYSIEPDNADFIFNEAVSLDHLHKSSLAAQYYRMALTAADRDGGARPIAFDRQQVRDRLLQLQP